jgi:two-component system, chemotaxis family, sensor kinase CheA
MDIEKYIAKFITESGENLDTLEAAIPLIETGQANDEVMDDAHRAAHSIKGAARIFGFDRIGNLAEELELVLRHVMKNRLAASPAVMGAVNTAHHALRQFVSAEETKKQLPADFEQGAISALKAISTPLESGD